MQGSNQRRREHQVMQVIVNTHLRQTDCGGKPGQAQVIKQASNPFYDA